MKIIVPTDFSKPSITALKFAVELAEKVAAEIEVIHIIHLPPLPETTFGIQLPLSNPSLLRTLENHADLLFDKMRKQCPPDINISFSTILDEVVPGILSHVKKTHADLLVVSPNNHDHRDTIFGTTVQRLVRQSNIPVISIPHKLSVISIKSILLATDLPLNQKHFVDQVKTVQQIFDATLHVLFVNSPELFLNSSESKKRLEKFAALYNLSDYTLNIRDNVSEIEGIREFMKEVDADLLLLGTHGRRGVPRLMNGSIAESSLAGLDLPMWISRTS